MNVSPASAAEAPRQAADVEEAKFLTDRAAAAWEAAEAAKRTGGRAAARRAARAETAYKPAVVDAERAIAAVKGLA